jgi:hypothetical protein
VLTCDYCLESMDRRSAVVLVLNGENYLFDKEICVLLYLVRYRKQLTSAELLHLMHTIKAELKA